MEIKDGKIPGCCYTYDDGQVNEDEDAMSATLEMKDPFLVQDGYIWVEHTMNLPLRISFDFIFLKTGSLMPVWSDQREE